jgi:microcystin-dependent protein
MAMPYVGEIRMFAGSFAPAGWAFCNGQMLQIAENEGLFQLIGTTFGGDGQETFAMPDMRGRIPIHRGTAAGGTTRGFATFGGDEQGFISVNQLPAHTHVGATSVVATKTSPINNLPGDTGVSDIYADGAGTAIASSMSAAAVGGSQPHNNVMPFLCVNFIICLFGLYPSEI